MKKKLIVLFALVLVLMPVMALAQLTTSGVDTGGTPEKCASTAPVDTIQGVMCKVANILSAIIPILILLGVLYFVYGVISYVIAGDSEAATKGRDRIIYGVIGLAAIVAVWGLVFILTNTFGLDNINTIEFPTVPF